MKKIIFILVLLLTSISSKAQFFHSIEFNNGISISSCEPLYTYSGLGYTDPVITPTKLLKYNYLTGLSTAINLKYFNHHYWNLSSQIGYLESGYKTEYESTDFNTNIKTQNYNVTYINILSFNTLFEARYPDWKIQPSLKFGYRIDYTFVESPYKMDKFNLGFVLGCGLNHQINKHFDLHTDFIYNWYAKDVNITYNNINEYHTISKESFSLNKNLCINLGFGYIF